jgi:hypothetical protein
LCFECSNIYPYPPGYFVYPSLHLPRLLVCMHVGNADRVASIIVIIYMFSHKSSFLTIVLQCLCMHISMHSGITKFIVSHTASFAVMKLMYLELRRFFTCCHLGQWHALNFHKGSVVSRQIIAHKTGGGEFLESK